MHHLALKRIKSFTVRNVTPNAVEGLEVVILCPLSVDQIGPAESYQLIVNERESSLRTATVLRSLVTETARYRVPY